MLGFVVWFLCLDLMDSILCGFLVIKFLFGAWCFLYKFLWNFQAKDAGASRIWGRQLDLDSGRWQEWRRLKVLKACFPLVANGHML